MLVDVCERPCSAGAATYASTMPMSVGSTNSAAVRWVRNLSLRFISATKALVRKAVVVGWAMTGGQDGAATVRRIALALAVRSPRFRDLVGSTAAEDRCPATEAHGSDRRSDDKPRPADVALWLKVRAGQAHTDP